MSDAVVIARGLTKKFGNTTAVNDLNLTIGAGVIYGFLGPNGCGKTTAMRLMTGLLTPTQGEVEVLGSRLPGNAEPLRRQIGYMTQTFSHYRDLSVYENLGFVANIYGLSRAKARARISELLEEYNLTEQAGQRAGSMSGGQKQRLSLAAAVLHRPKLLFLDEPTSAVDPETRRAFWEKLFDLVDQGASIVVSTHFMDEAERCHRIAILDKGTKRADGEPFQLMKDLGLAVIEIAGDQLRDVKKTLAAAPEVVSAAQVGARLRVLVKDTTPDPVDTVRRLSGLGSAGEVHKTRPNLEDVFVNATRGAP